MNAQVRAEIPDVTEVEVEAEVGAEARDCRTRGRVRIRVWMGLVAALRQAQRQEA